LTELLCSKPDRARWNLVLAHGAGAPMDSPFMQAFSEPLTEMGGAVGGINVVRFEFPYMAKRRVDGGRGPPDRGPKLQAEYRQVVLDLRKRWPRRGLVIGGKSMGGRIASMIADEAGVDGLVCLGYPFHPAGKPERLRVAHLEGLATPALFCQGSRDALGSEVEVTGYALNAGISFCWLPDGDHSFKPRKRSGFNLEQHYQTAQARIIQFLTQLPRQ
jgi:predicted alpha/beta-hydrolase family hydrolase